MKNLNRRHFLAASSAFVTSALLPEAALSAEWNPTKPVTLVVSYPAGGGADLMARLIAQPMAEFLGTSVIVENKPGAGGQLATTQVVRSAPDGHTVLLDASSYAVNESLYAKLPYDQRKDLSVIGVLATFPNVLVSYPYFEAKNVKEVVAAAVKAPNTIAYASSGNGSAQHLAGALFEDRAKISLTHVPYKGGGPAMNDVMGGQVPLFFANVASSLGFIQSGRLRPLAVTARNRAASLPDVPTMEEAGVSGYEVLEWNPLAVPSKTPAEIQAKLREALQFAINSPNVKKRLEDLGGSVFDNSSPDNAKKFVEHQMQQWSKIIKDRGIQVG